MLPKDIKKIKYIDAHYSYASNKKPPSGEITCFGRIINENIDCIDVELAWSNKPHDTIFGVVIPRGLIENTKKKNNIKCTAQKNETIAVYWNDIFVYDEQYKGDHITTSMLTEGILFKKTDSYILIKDPETLNLVDVVNHPEIKPKLYYIPIAMITEIKCVRKT